MCGIAGFTGLGDKKTLERMTNAIRHRGPDDAGFFLSPPLQRGAGGVSLGMRRLSIIDVEGGQQPLYNEDKSIGVICNGEIYNYQKLKNNLEKKGHSFKSRSDVEVIPHLYEELGPGLFTELNGMFAIALWDKRQDQLIIARDRLGQKPLYYAKINGNFYFASELKVFNKLVNFNKQINKSAFLKFIDQTYIGGQQTIFNQVKKLPPGYYAIVKNDQLSIRQYWQLPDLNDNVMVSPSTSSGQALSNHDITLRQAQADKINFTDAINHLDNLISDAVSIRLMSDVPLGVFLSGGLDSSLIAYYAQQRSSQPIKTFNVSFDDSSFDESQKATRVSKILNTDHVQANVSEAQLLSTLEDLPAIMDEPFADTSLMPAYWLAKQARQSFTVALSGDAADELCMGYQTFQAWQPWYIAKLMPTFLRRFLQQLVKILPNSSSYFSLDFKLKRGLLRFDKNPHHQHFRWYSPFSTAEIIKLINTEVFSQDTINSYFNYKTSWPLSFSPPYQGGDKGGVNPFNLSAHLYQKYYLPDDIFTKLDRASMAVSLEARSPYADYRLFEFMNALPAKYKFNNYSRKYLLKKVATKYLPRDVAYGTKHGFAAPIYKWLQGPLRDKINELFSKSILQKHSLLNPKYVNTIWRDFLEGNSYRARQIWTLFCWQLWSQKYLNN